MEYTVYSIFTVSILDDRLFVKSWKSNHINRNFRINVITKIFNIKNETIAIVELNIRKFENN